MKFGRSAWLATVVMGLGFAATSASALTPPSKTGAGIAPHAVAQATFWLDHEKKHPRKHWRHRHKHAHWQGPHQKHWHKHWHKKRH